MDEFISEKEVAQILGVNQRTVGRWADQGKLTRYRQFGVRVRYKRVEVENFARPVPDVSAVGDEQQSTSDEKQL